MLRFAVATIATFGILMLMNSAVTSANSPGLEVTIDGLESYAEFSVAGVVSNPQGGIPLKVELSGDIEGLYDVDGGGHYYAHEPAEPGAVGSVQVKAIFNGETVTADTIVESGFGSGSGV